jgi:hypothetical protein
MNISSTPWKLKKKHIELYDSSSSSSFSFLGNDDDIIGDWFDPAYTTTFEWALFFFRFLSPSHFSIPRGNCKDAVEMQSGEDGTTRTICLSHSADDGRGEGFQLFRVEIRDKKKGKDLFIFWVLSFTLITHRPTAADAAAMVLTCLTDPLPRRPDQLSSLRMCRPCEIEEFSITASL